MSYLDDERKELERAPFLFSDLPEAVRERIEEREQVAEDWTAARLFSKKREIYEAAVRMLGADLHVRMIALFLGISEKSVVAVREQERPNVTAFRERLGVRRRNVMSRLVDNMVLALDGKTMGLKEGAAVARDLSVALNILDGQERLDAGAPTQIIEHHEAPAVEEYEAFMKTVVDVESERLPQTGSVVGMNGTKGAGEPGPSDPEPEEPKP